MTIYDKLEKFIKLKGSNPTRLPRSVSESVLLWDIIKLKMERIKAGRIIILILN